MLAVAEREEQVGRPFLRPRDEVLLSIGHAAYNLDLRPVPSAGRCPLTRTALVRRQHLGRPPDTPFMADSPVSRQPQGDVPHTASQAAPAARPIPLHTSHASSVREVVARNSGAQASDDIDGGRLTSMKVRPPTALERFERQTGVPVLVLSLAMIPLLAAPLFLDLAASQEAALHALDWFIWALFVVEYLVRLVLAPQRWRFIRSHPIDLLLVLIPVFRPLRVLRVFRALRVVVVLLRVLGAVRDVLTRHKLHYALAIGLVAVFGGAGMVFEAERGAEDASILSFPDALWWAARTVTTVGYGDMTPTTPIGRGVAVVLMVLGIGLFGLLAGTLASYFVSKDETEASTTSVDERLARIERALGIEDD